MYENGVRVEKLEVEKGKGKFRVVVLGFFFCMASKACREARTKIKIASNGTSSASDHQGVHNITSKDTEQIQKSMKRRADNMAKQRRAERTSKTESAALPWNTSRSTPSSASSPSTTWSTKHERKCSLSNHRGTSLPVEKLNSKGVKRTTAEIYDTAMKIFKKNLEHLNRSSPIPFVHVNIDLWTAKYSARKAPNFKVESNPLACKLYKPGAEVNDLRAREMLKLWAGHFLEGFGLDWSDVLGAVTDNGSDVKYAFSTIPGVLRE